MPLDRLLTSNEAAEYLRVTWSTLHSWRNKGIGPSYSRVGKRVVYSESDLKKWIKAQRTTSAQDAA